MEANKSLSICNLYKQKLSLFDIVYFGANAFFLSLAIIIFGNGFLKGNIAFMGTGAVLWALSYLANGVKNPIKQMVIIGPYLSNVSKKIAETAAQVCPENYSLYEAISLINSMLLEEGGEDDKCIRNSDIYKDALSSYAKALLKFDEIKRYVITKQAIDEKITEIDPEEYDKGLRKFLDGMQNLLGIGSSEKNAVWEEVLNDVFGDYIAENGETVNQMKYNLNQMFSITKERKETKYKRNFEEMMAGSWISW